MSLGKLLATGRSLVGGAPDEGRYNLSPRNRLPRFGGEKNPFAPASINEAPAKLPAAPTTPAVNAPQAVSRQAFPHRLSGLPGGPAEVAGRNDPSEAMPPAEAPGEHAPISPCTASAASPAPVAQASPVAAARAPRFGVKARLIHGVTVLRGWAVRGWAWTLQRVARVRGGIRRPQAAFIPRFGRPVVQAELSLDDVKVVRSDLTESDLEFVEPTTSTLTTPGPKAPVASANRGPVPPALKKLTDRILGPVAH